MVSKTKRNHENWELPQLVIEPTGSVLADCLREQPGLRVSMVSKFHTSLRGQVTSAAMPSILTDDVRPPLL